ncbi:hypothetical protein [Hymenobacter sp. BT491]|uniref:hypothetical protein n=1 Tax=Hymenobacter sp. BT491 TaxID=2766779 RepID=UPI001653AD80|nr:hypothetical protein [Hymenobacter sp. BT491]MBC6992273.1 hypothetical protein [Hymenobacter sp. BT491]
MKLDQLNEMVLIGNNLPSWLLDIVLLSHLSGIAVSAIRSLLWSELIMTTQARKQVIIIAQAGHDLDQLSLVTLKNQATNIIRELLRQGYVDTTTKYIFTPSSRDILEIYENQLSQLSNNLIH